MPIKEIVFKRPLDNPTLEELSFEMGRGQSQELGVGVHDVTPSGFRDKYEVSVEDPGDGNTVGEVMVTRRGGRAISSAIIESGRVDFEQSPVTEKKISLDKGNPLVLLSRPNVLDDPEKQGFSVHGVIYYDPK